MINCTLKQFFRNFLKKTKYIEKLKVQHCETKYVASVGSIKFIYIK